MTELPASVVGCGSRLNLRLRSRSEPEAMLLSGSPGEVARWRGRSESWCKTSTALYVLYNLSYGFSVDRSWSRRSMALIAPSAARNDARPNRELGGRLSDWNRVRITGSEASTSRAIEEGRSDSTVRGSRLSSRAQGPADFLIGGPEPTHHEATRPQSEGPSTCETASRARRTGFRRSLKMLKVYGRDGFGGEAPTEIEGKSSDRPSV